MEKDHWLSIQPGSSVKYFWNNKNIPVFNVNTYYDKFDEGGTLKYIKPFELKDGTQRHRMVILSPTNYTKTVNLAGIKSIWVASANSAASVAASSVAAAPAQCAPNPVQCAPNPVSMRITQSCSMRITQSRR